MFNSEHLFRKYSKQRAVIWQSSFENQEQLNYDEIIKASKVVKSVLQEFLKNDQNNIGVLLHHSAEIVPVILGILDSCATFCCLNQNQSPVELTETINLLRCNIGVADKEFLLKHSNKYEALKDINIFTKSLVVVRLSTENFVITSNSSCNDIEGKDIRQSSKPMFCCSTSGTTGKPKMVQVPFKCLLPNVLSLSKHYEITQSDVIYISSPPTFDPFVVDLLLGLFNGATILFVSNEIRLSTGNLLSSLETNSVTIMQITPSLFRRFSMEAIQNRLLPSSSALRCLILGGESFPSIEEVALWFDVNGEIEMHTRLFNVYGITEVSCWSSIYELTLVDITCKNLIPIGLPLDRYTALKVVDCVSKEVIENGIGELFIESKIRKCLLHESGQTNVLESVATGDLVEIKSGTIYYKTRLNNMVKIFGRKVNLTKIENTTKTYWSINEACCVYDKDHNSLNLFVQCGKQRKYTRKEILQGLRQKLLEEEVPNEIYFVNEFPLSCHGKISKSKLLEMVEKPSSCFRRDYFVTKLEENLPKFDFEITSKLSFLAAGGSSVLALQLINELETKLNFSDPNLMTMLLNSDINIAQIMIHLQDHRPNNLASHLARKSSETLRPVPCTWCHDMEKCIDASPTICKVDNKDIVSVGSHSHVLLNVDLASGRLLSKLKLPHRIECPVVQFNSYGLVGCYDGYVYCFEMPSGTERWKFNSHGMVKSRPSIVGKFVVFGNYNSEFNVWCLRADNGSFVWKTKIGNKSIYAGIVATMNDKLIVNTLDGVCAIVEPLTGESLWETRLQSPIFSTPKALRNIIFVAEVLGMVHCIDYCLGEILGSFKADGNIYSSIESIGDSDSICFGCYDKSVYCLSFDMDASVFRLLWKVETSGQLFSSPKSFVFDSISFVLVCSTDGMVCILDSNGVFCNQFRIDGEIFSTPSVADNKVIIASRNNFLYCYDFDQILAKGIS